MKKIIVLSCLFMAASVGYSQSNNIRLQGPKAKNYKPWISKSKFSKLVYIQNRTFKKGPAAKNAKPWHIKESNQNYVEIKTGSRHNLQGPKAKNFKPWQSSSAVKADNLLARGKQYHHLQIYKE